MLQVLVFLLDLVFGSSCGMLGVMLVIFGYQSINWFWIFNHWTLNFYSWERKKWVKTLMRSRFGGWFRLGKVLNTLNDFGIRMSLLP